MRINLTAYSHDRLLRDCGGHEKRFARHSVVTPRIVGGHAAFVTKGKNNPVPWKVAADPGEFRINRPGRVSPGKCDAKQSAFSKGFTRAAKDKLGRLGDEIFRPDDFALHFRHGA